MQQRSIVALRRAWCHRDQIGLAVAFMLTVTALLASAPILLAIAALRYDGKRREPLAFVVTVRLARAVVWLWDELHGVPHRPWQPCLQLSLIHI